MKVFIVIRTESSYDGFHYSESTSIEDVFATKELAKSHCSPTQTEQNSGEECTTEWHYEEWNIKQPSKKPLTGIEKNFQEDEIDDMDCGDVPGMYQNIRARQVSPL